MVVVSDVRSAPDSCLLFWHEELEGLSWFEVLGLVAGDIWIAIELQLARPRAFLEVQFVQLCPKNAWAVGVLVIVDLVLLVTNSEPKRVSYVGLARNPDADRSSPAMPSALLRHCKPRSSAAWACPYSR